MRPGTSRIPLLVIAAAAGWLLFPVPLPAGDGCCRGGAAQGARAGEAFAADRDGHAEVRRNQDVPGMGDAEI